MNEAPSVTVCPFIERNIQQEFLPLQFVNLIEKEMREQQHQIEKKTRRHIQIDLNKLYHWNSTMTESSYNVLRRVILGSNKVNPILEQDIKTDKTATLLALATEEYKYQLEQVKRGQKRSIKVDYNLLYC